MVHRHNLICLLLYTIAQSQQRQHWCQPGFRSASGEGFAASSLSRPRVIALPRFAAGRSSREVICPESPDPWCLCFRILTLACAHAHRLPAGMLESKIPALGDLPYHCSADPATSHRKRKCSRPLITKAGL
ncbi:hypothetical protein F5883DRAFT_550655 [Diaporthe sp. PMI_573]|nr:hypothetical protein F5883DRAFT_550655 [Diaporthaceae sp. PMI_573]